MRKYVDLSRTFTDGMPAYPGGPRPELKVISNPENEGVTAHYLKSDLHTGTHIDAPWHMLPGKKISEIPVERFCGTGLLIDARGHKEIDARLLDGHVLTPEHIVLVWTGFAEKFFEKEYYEAHPVMTEAFAHRLSEAKVKMVGIDTPSPDNPPFAIHRILLPADVLIIENLAGLEQLRDANDIQVIALPVKFEAEAGFARVIAIIKG